LPGADFYRIVISKTLCFDTFDVDTSGIKDTRFPYIYWKRKPCIFCRSGLSIEINSSDWSETKDFTIADISKVSTEDAQHTTVTITYNGGKIFINAYVPSDETEASLYFYNFTGSDVLAINDFQLSRGKNVVNTDTENLGLVVYFYKLFINNHLYFGKILITN
jgi:hypothetical protein